MLDKCIVIIKFNSRTEHLQHCVFDITQDTHYTNIHYTDEIYHRLFPPSHYQMVFTPSLL